MLTEEDKTQDSRPHLDALLLIGDSLTDRGEMEERKLFGVIPMSWLSGLKGKSPDGRFTNGYNWADLLSYLLIHLTSIERVEEKAHLDFEIAHESDLSQLKDKIHWEHSPYKESARFYQKSFTDDDIYTVKRKAGQFSRLFDEGKDKACNRVAIADAILTGDKAIKDMLDANSSLEDEDLVKYKGKKFVRSYAEGGLTSQRFTRSFKSLWTWNFKNLFSRLILKNLDKMRQRIFGDDERENHSQAERHNTLVIEWSGANDLATVSSRPTTSLARKTALARIANVREMIAHGYCHFVLFELPDISKVPRYKTSKKDQRNFACTASDAFNDTLKEEVDRLKDEYPHCQFDVFEVNETMDKVFDNPEAYGFDKDKLTECFLDHCDDPINEEGRSPTDGYLFWDDVHPTADLQALIALELAKFLESKYDVNPQAVSEYHLHDKPAALRPSAQQTETVEIKCRKTEFVKAYARKLDDEYHKTGGRWRKSKAPYLKEATLQQITNYGLLHPKSRTHDVMKDLGWIRKTGWVKEQEGLTAELKAETGLTDPRP